MSPPDRDVRPAPSQSEFDKLVIPTPPPTVALPRMRLAGRSYASQFYPNPKSRFTPISWTYPCVYLGASKRTAVAEVYGDTFWANRKAGIVVLDLIKAKDQAFMEAPIVPAVKLVDLTHPDVRFVTGFEGGTIYTTDLSIPQTWAERIANHPAHFDGILFRSRPTDEPCMVLWNRHGGRTIEKEMTFPIVGEFAGSPEAYEVAHLCQVRLAFA